MATVRKQWPLDALVQLVAQQEKRKLSVPWQYLARLSMAELQLGAAWKPVALTERAQVFYPGFVFSQRRSKYQLTSQATHQHHLPWEEMEAQLVVVRSLEDQSGW